MRVNLALQAAQRRKDGVHDFFGLGDAAFGVGNLLAQPGNIATFGKLQGVHKLGAVVADGLLGRGPVHISRGCGGKAVDG